MKITLDSGSQSYWLGTDGYFSFVSLGKFLEYFFLPLKLIYDKENYDCIIHGNNSSEVYYNRDKIHIFLSVENLPAHHHYQHYITYGNYGNSNISIYVYNHIDKIEETSSYIAIPVIYCQLTYFTQMYKSILPSKLVSFQDKKFCILLSTNKYRKDVKSRVSELLSTIGRCDTIDIYKSDISNKSCYHSDELLNLIQSYKFAFVCENSIADGYVTEKIFNCLFARTIPIYNGSPKIEVYINKKCFINTNDLSSLCDRLEEIKYLATDETAYNEKINAYISDEYDDEGYAKRLQEFMMKQIKVSVVIPTYNRFSYVLNAIESVKRQTHKNIEIIVVNDRSTQKEYYAYDFPGVTILHLEKNSKTIFGFPCAGYVRNYGIQVAKGKYVAFLDDDDIWFPKKIELQLAAMQKTGCKMSSTEGLIGRGVYRADESYKLYNSDHYYETLQGIYRAKGSQFLDNGFPSIWSLDFLKIHNCIITSSFIIEKELLITFGKFKHLRNGDEDYGCWLTALEYTNLAYVSDVCFYYDLLHGGRCVS
jgi:hypothetical protein